MIENYIYNKKLEVIKKLYTNDINLILFQYDSLFCDDCSLLYMIC